MHEVYVYSGPTKSGKTTKLMQWAASQKNIDGIFQPVIDGKRFLYHISSRTLKKLESETETINIGNYKFSIESFNWAQNVLLESIKSDFEWIIIDEIGPLELQEKGLEPVIKTILSVRKKYQWNLICVVRESMLKKFLEHYQLEEQYKILEI